MPEACIFSASRRRKYPFRENYISRLTALLRHQVAALSVLLATTNVPLEEESSSVAQANAEAGE